MTLGGIPRRAVLDTDTVSALIRRAPSVLAAARLYYDTHSRFTVSLVTRYEIIRGLQVKGATVQLRTFDVFCSRNEVLPLDDSVILRAAEIYADLHRRGQLIGDGDIFIAATALVHGLTVVTNNERHFGRIAGLDVANWSR